MNKEAGLGMNNGRFGQRVMLCHRFLKRAGALSVIYLVNANNFSRNHGLVAHGIGQIVSHCQK